MQTQTFLALIAAGVISQGAWADCHTVYVGDTVVYRSVEAPVDMSLPISQTIPAKFGQNAVMLSSPDTTDCPFVASVQARTEGNFVAAEGVRKRPQPKRPLIEQFPDSSNSAERPPVDMSQFFTGPEYAGAGQGGEVQSIIGGSASSRAGDQGDAGPRGGQYRYTAAGKKAYLGSDSGARR